MGRGIVKATKKVLADKEFLYVEQTEGGMTPYLIRDNRPPTFLRNWMELAQQKSDRALVKWMGDAEVGDIFDHRLGIMIRVRPNEGKERRRTA